MVLTATTLFFNNPSGPWATLTAAITTTSATSFSAAVPAGVAVSSSAVPPTQTPVRIDSELLMVTNISGTTWTVTRGVGGTAAATHVVGSVVTPVPIAEVLGVAGTLDATARTMAYVDSTLVARRHGVNIKPGSNVTVVGADNPGLDAVDVTIGAATVQLRVRDEGVDVPQATILNFSGPGVTVSRNATTDAYDVTILGVSSGGGSGTVSAGGVATWGP